MTELPLLVGEAPSRTGDRYHMFPLSGAVAQRICGLAGISPVEGGTRYGQWTWALYARFECVNLFERYADATPWSVPLARERAALLGVEDRVVVCLGRRVQTAVWTVLPAARILPLPPLHAWRFNVPGEPHALVAIPHPSGLNRLLNSEEERARCGETLRSAMATTTA